MIQKRLNIIRRVTLLGVTLLVAGCSSTDAAHTSDARSMRMMGRPEAMAVKSFDTTSNQMLVERASVDIEVSDLAQAEEVVLKDLTSAGGRIEQQRRSQYTVFLRMRVSPERLKPLVGGWETLGKVLRNEISAEDVTARHADAAARLKNHYALRDRLRDLLKNAKEVKDILAIESELNRIQSDIDALEAVRNTLTEQCKDAELSLKLSAKIPEKKQTLGPLGWVCYGTWWGVRKLFIWSDGN